MHEVWEQGSNWRKRLQRVLDLVDTPGRYGVAGQVLALDASGRRFEWMTPEAGLGGSGTAGQVTVWASASTLTGFATFTYQNTGSPNVLIQAANAAHVPVVVRGAASQTGNLQEWQNSGGTAGAMVDARGVVCSYGAMPNDNTLLGINSGNLTATGSDNILIGDGVGAALTSGYSNIVMGLAAGAALTTGNRNIILGQNAGAGFTTGYHGIAIGTDAGIGITTATYTVSIGYRAHRYANGSHGIAIGNQAGIYTTGQQNVFIGNYAGYYNSTGTNNVFVGGQAGYGKSGASQTEAVAIGYRALYGAETTEGNVAVGALAGRLNITTGNYNILLGYYVHVPSGTSSYQMSLGNLIYGVGVDGTQATVSSGCVGIGENAPVARLHVTRASAVTNTVENAFIVAHGTSGTAAAGFGVQQSHYIEDSGGNQRAASYLTTLWNDAAAATYKADVILQAVDAGGTREILRGRANGSAAALAFYGGTPVARGAALTAQLTTITHTAPGTPDYALQDFVDVAGDGSQGWAFKTQDEANTLLAVVANLQTRMAELQTRLGAASGVNLIA